jgi:hypothetical protein
MEATPRQQGGVRRPGSHRERARVAGEALIHDASISLCDCSEEGRHSTLLRDGASSRVRTSYSDLPQDIRHHLLHPIVNLALARQPPDAVEVIAQRHDRWLFLPLAMQVLDLAQPHTREQAIA